VWKAEDQIKILSRKHEKKYELYRLSEICFLDGKLTTMDQPPESAAAKKERTGGLGTFAGVFTPSILTILALFSFCAWGM
jgi:hypothetical protein